MTSEPAPLVSIDEARDYLRMRHDRDDDLINRLVCTATEFHENRIGRQLMQADFTLTLDGFPLQILLPRPPCVEVTQIAYVDTAGDSQTLSSSVYQVDLNTEPARICPAPNEVWPSTRTQFAAVTVTYKAGYGTDPQLVPQQDASVILAMVERMYRNSSGVSERPQRTVAMAAEAVAVSRRVYY